MRYIVLIYGEGGGGSFREKYSKLDFLKNYNVPILALTGTATDRTVNIVTNSLRLDNPVIIKMSLARSNLELSVIRKTTKPVNQIVNLIKSKHRDQCGIVYCSKRSTTMDIAHALKLQGVAATFLHGALEDHKRRANEKVWKEDKVTVMCATKSFCMGIDKPGVKFVHHFDYPENCEDYFQQVSRAGRNDANTICNFLFAIEDRNFYVQNLKALKNEEERSFKMEKLNTITEYCMQTTVFRHKILMAYFGGIVHPCEGKCDICIKLTARSSLDKTEEAKIVLECLKELKKRSAKVSLRVFLLTLLGSIVIEVLGQNPPGHNPPDKTPQDKNPLDKTPQTKFFLFHFLNGFLSAY